MFQIESDRHKEADRKTVESAKAAHPLERESERNCIHNAGRSENREMCDHGCGRARGGIEIESDHEMEPRRVFDTKTGREQDTGPREYHWVQ